MKSVKKILINHKAYELLCFEQQPEQRYDSKKNIPFFRGRYTKKHQRAMPIPNMTKANTDTIMVIKYELSSALSRFVVAEEKDHK